MTTITLLAHPHMFIDTNPTIVMDKNGLKGVEVSWVFDDMFSSVVIKDYDKNKDQKFNQKELAKLKKEAFDYTAEYHYFTKLTLGKKQLPMGAPQNFTPTIKKGRLIYHFFIPCLVPVKKGVKKVKLSIFDPTFYISFEFPEKNPVNFRNSELYTTSVKEHDPSAKALFVAPTTSLEFIISLKRTLKKQL